MVNSLIVVNVYFNGQAASYGLLVYILVILDWLKQQCTKIFVKITTPAAMYLSALPRLALLP